MASRLKYIYNVREIIEAFKITDDSNLDDDHIGFLIDQKRAKEIRDTYMRNRKIEPIWLQDYGIVNTTPVNKSEDQTLTVCKCQFSKVILPPIVSLHDELSGQNDLGCYRIASSCGNFEYHRSTIEELALITPDSHYSLYKYYSRIGNAYYLTPTVGAIRPLLIQENPLDGFVVDNTDKLSGQLVSGQSYTIRSGNITYNGTRYEKGQSFTAGTIKTFTGNGKVGLTNQKRQMTNNDEYPMSFTMAEVVIMKVLTQDFNINAEKIIDLKNNSRDGKSGA